MISDAYIRVTCDGCKAEEEIPLTVTARGFDDRNVEKAIANLGWKAVGEDDHRCADCLAEGDEEVKDESLIY